MPKDVQPRPSRVEVVVSNRNAEQVQLLVEPWARELTLPANGTARVEFEGPDRVVLEVRVLSQGLVIYGWEGSVISDASPQLIEKGRAHVQTE